MREGEESRGSKTSYMRRATGWVGIFGSIVTIALTVWNAHTKSQIDDVEIKLRARLAEIEESKERVDRYKWILSLFPELTDKDPIKRGFTVSLTMLALTESEATRLFASLQTSSIPELQLAGRSGNAAIQNEAVAQLVSRMNAATAAVRNDALERLKSDYKASSQAVTLTLQTFDKNAIDGLSPQGMINGLLFLNVTELPIWSAQQLETARQAVINIEKRGPGPQTRVELDRFKALLKTAAANH